MSVLNPSSKTPSDQAGKESSLHGNSQHAKDPPPCLSEYEQQRLLHIARNREYMALLGLAEDAGAQMAAQEAKGRANSDDPAGRRRPKKPAPERDAPCRRSGRLVGRTPDYTGEHIDAFGDELESIPSAGRKSKRIKEYYCHDAWRLLCCVALMSRVSSADTKHRCIAAFFAVCPTPSALLDSSPDAILRVILPLGLFPSRFRSLVEMSRRFIEMPEFDIALEGPNKVYGFGEFGYQSFRIFVRGDLRVRPSDKHLQAFLVWQNRNKTSEGEAPPV
eukprot:jgi/Mesvir1/17939/Mv12992-RA.1